MNLFLYNIKQTLKNIKKNGVFSVLTIVSLTVGVTVFFMTALYVFHENEVDMSFKNSNRIYRLYDAKNNDSGLGYELADVISNNYPDAEANCVLERFEWPVVLKTDKQSLKFKTGISTTNKFFDVFNIPVISKTGDKPFSENASVILTRATAKKLFGDENPLGKSVNINGFFNTKVTAVIAGFPDNTSLDADYLLNAEPENMRMSRNCNNGDCYSPMNHYLLLKKNVDKNRFINNFNNTIRQYQTRVDSFAIQPLTSIYLSKHQEYSGNREGNPAFLKIISVIGLIILLLAIINYLNFSISLQHAKLKEISIKKINGAGNRQLFAYYLSESVVVVMLAIVMALLITYTFKGLYYNIFNDTPDFRALTRPLFIAGFIITVLIILFINSIIPAYSLLKLNVVNGLNGKIKRGSKNRARTIFTITQFVVSIALLIAVLFIHKQLTFVETKDLGFNKENLIKIEIPYTLQERDALKQKLENLSFVKSSAYSFGYPGEINLVMGSGQDDNDADIECILTDSNFIKTFQVSLIKGRNFLKGDYKKGCVFNEAAMKRLGYTDLKNRKFNNGRKGGYNIVGVVKDFKVSSLHDVQKPVCLIYDDSNKPNVLSVRMLPGDIKTQLSQIKQIWTSLTDNPFEFQFYDTYFNSLYIKEQKLSLSITVLAIIAIILTLIGVLGQVIQSTVYRTKEVGIRKVNGASVSEILLLLNLDFVKWTLIAFIVATPLAWYGISKWLENFAYKIDLSWWIFVLSGLTVLIVTMLVASWLTFKTARRNPVKALRYE